MPGRKRAGRQRVPASPVRRNVYLQIVEYTMRFFFRGDTDTRASQPHKQAGVTVQEEELSFLEIFVRRRIFIIYCHAGLHARRHAASPGTPSAKECSLD